MNILDAHVPASAPRNSLRGGFSYARDPHGGFLLYSPAGVCFAWCESRDAVSMKLAREEHEQLWS